jgi:hypothetical protein
MRTNFSLFTVNHLTLRSETRLGSGFKNNSDPDQDQEKGSGDPDHYQNLLYKADF